MLAAGTRVGPYEVVSWLGAGGMGEVYRARDTKLEREVALKTLPEDLARQPRRLTRLRTEARILASLNHPGIAILHGLEDFDGGVPVLVMELVEGETLADRLRRGPLPLREALTVAHQITLALEAAHQKGVLHRDLKPANIRLSREGRVKVLDFGLADVVREAFVDSQIDTHTSPSSDGHAVLGTAPYMSPEQARGQEVDRRSDVWAFGCVLFEMLSGQRAFGGQTFSDTVAAVLEHEPDWSPLPKQTPSLVLRLLRRCLQKDRDRRLHDVADGRLDLEEALSQPTPSEEALRTPRFRAVPLTMGVVVATLALVGLGLTGRPSPAPKPVVRLSLERSGEQPGDLVVDPTGERVAYRTSSGLVVRDLDKSEGRLMPNTAAGFRPFFSPDGKRLGFNDRADSTLKEVSLLGGSPVTVCKGVPQLYGATWGPDETIVFTPDSNAGLWQVPSSGGEPRELTKPDHGRGEKSHRWPHFLPGGKAVLFTRGTGRLTTWDDARIEALLLGSGERHTILGGGTSAVYVESGHLVYRRGNAILAVPFDLDRLATIGAPVAVVEDVEPASRDGFPSFTVGHTGMLAFVPHSRSSERLVAVDRAGTQRPLTPFMDAVREPRVSPDGHTIAMRRGAANDQVWRFDIERQALSQVTFEWDNYVPAWTPDGESLIVSSPGKLLRIRADGTGHPETLLTTPGSTPNTGSVTGDGKIFAYDRQGTTTREDIWILPLEREGEPRIFLQTPAAEIAPAISPDGRSLAYISDESGTTKSTCAPSLMAIARSRCHPAAGSTRCGREAGGSSSTGFASGLGSFG
jgi:eukaryotic-like serine/threonine-protein kinase